MEPPIRYAKTEDGVSIAYAVAGDGPPLIRLGVPGFSHVQRDWTINFGMVQELTQAFRLIWFDQRGTGLSQREPTDFSMDSMVSDVEAVVEATALQSFSLAAFADSVPIAVTYAAKHRDRVSHLILVDGWIRISDSKDRPAFEIHSALIDKEWTLYTETLVRVLMGLDDSALAESLGEHMRACVEPEAYRAFDEATKSYDVSDLLSIIEAKTLVLRNNDNRFVPASVGQELAAEIPNARFLAIDDMSYQNLNPMIEDFVGVMKEQTPAGATASSGLMTILFTDIESSTALAQQRGDAAAQEVRRTHNELVRSALSGRGGSEVKHTGDGIMATFQSASAALECAISIQRGVANHKEEHPDSPLGVYIGLNAGEPIAEDDDLFGTSVDLAARLVGHAEPGQIIASDVVRQLAAGKDFLFSDLGETELRGFEDPVKLWELRWQDEG